MLVKVFSKKPRTTKIEQLTKEKDEEINRREQMLKDIKASHADSIAWATELAVQRAAGSSVI